jgi:hypothetical protein
MLKVNKLTLFHITIVILAIILVSCSTSPSAAVEAKNFFTLTDYKDETHSYSKPIIIKHLKTDTLYCKNHHCWEIIRAVYIMDEGKFNYFIGRNLK